MKQTEKEEKSQKSMRNTYRCWDTQICTHRKPIKLKSKTVTYKQKHYEVKKMPPQRYINMRQTTKQNPPKLPSSLFYVGYLPVGMGPFIKYGLYR